MDFEKSQVKEDLEKKVKRILLYEGSFDWEKDGVFNPGVIVEDNQVHIIYRAIKCENYSRLGYLKLKKENQIEKYQYPVISPTEPYEKQGIEDPRVTKIEDSYYITYTAYDGKSARISVAESKNLLNFKKLGIISPNITFLEAFKISQNNRYKNFWKRQIEQLGENIIIWDKDGCLFSEKINGKYALLHRIEPDIQIVYFNDFFELKNKEFWEEYFREIESKIVMKPKYKWEEEKIGAGAPPIKTKYGWLLLYHGVDKNRVYRAGLSLLDIENPQKEIARLPFPLFEPDYDWEKNGNVPNVVFPTGAFIKDEVLYIFYGCADKRIGCAEIELKEINKILKRSKS
ncbi:MAG: pesticidal protein Cry7Aa [Candidatus Omnitrophica bacterium]|nr:pesticidal protein Cry7Aa [Candidatus Omnitrophota bacterium]MCM8809909.1 pesticidal protein Cry7Aa [Candidatus Omnitrophota bacterium]